MRCLLLLGVTSALFTGCTDNNDTSAPTTTGNTRPEANAGADILQSGDEPVTLDGHGSFDADGDTLTYSWSFEYVPETSGVADRDAPFSVNHSIEAVTTSFAPDVTGTYVVKLVVSDGKANSEPDHVVVTVSEPEDLPVAMAGPDQTLKLGSVAYLNGSASYDPNGGQLTYAWAVVDVPDASGLTNSDLVGPTTVEPHFTPDVAGVYLVNLVVSNGLAWSRPDAAVITVTGLNGPPTANAGEDFTNEDCAAIPLDATGSIDPDGDQLRYFWELQGKPAASGTSNADFADRTAAVTSFWADVDGTYVFSVAVNDGTFWSVPDIVVVTVYDRKYNSEPVVEAGLDKSFDGGSAECEESGYAYECDDCAVIRAALGEKAFIHDADSDPYTYLWTVIDGEATIADPSSLETTVTLTGAAPIEPGACENNDFTFQLTAVDCPGATVGDTVTYTVVCCGTKEK